MRGECFWSVTTDVKVELSSNSCLHFQHQLSFLAKLKIHTVKEDFHRKLKSCVLQWLQIHFYSMLSNQKMFLCLSIRNKLVRGHNHVIHLCSILTMNVIVFPINNEIKWMCHFKPKWKLMSMKHLWQPLSLFLLMGTQTGWCMDGQKFLRTDWTYRSLYCSLSYAGEKSNNSSDWINWIYC